MPPRKPHTLQRISDAVTSTPWAILPEKADEICAFFDQRLEGDLLSESEIKAAIGPADGEDDDPTTIDGVRVLSVRGTITPKATFLSRFSGGASCEIISAQLQKALKDDKVRAIIMRMDSPGGSVHGVAELAAEIYAGRQIKPIYGWVDNGLCCSAMYWIGSACTKLYASEGSESGSIGVIAIHREFTKAAKSMGVKYHVLRSVQNKAIGQAVEVLDEAKRGVLMERIQSWHTAFIGAVALHRNIAAAAVDERFGHGKTYRADQAVDLGLIDGIKTFSQVFDSLREVGGDSGVSTKEVQMNEQVKGALVARKIIPNFQTSDETAESALNAFFAGKGIERPEKDDDVVAAIFSNTSPAVTPEKPPETDDGKGKGNVDDDPDAAKNATAAERERWTELGSTGRLMGISDQEILQAQEGGWSIETAVKNWKKSLTDDNPGVDPGAIRPTGSAYDAFLEGATDAILSTLQQVSEGEKTSEHMKDFQHLRIVDIAKRGLALANIRLAPGLTAEEMCEQFVKLSGTANMPLVASSGPTYGPGHYPDLFGNVANRILNRGMNLSGATYPEWTSRIPSVSDFRPRTIINTGAFGLFSHIIDGKEIEESEFGSEQNWIQISRFGDKCKLTPVMMANDDLDAWSQALQALGAGGPLSINAAAISLLFSTAAMPDGNAFFSSAHGNVLASGGGGPSITQTDNMRKLMRQQREPSKRLLVSPAPAIALVPTKHETGAEQLYMPRLTEQATQQSQVNPFRGKIKPIFEGMLDTYSADVWFLAADPGMHRGIVVMHQTGYETGKRRRYWDEKTQCLYHEQEIRYAVGVADYRKWVKNPGT